MTLALEALSGVSVASASSDRLELKLTTDLPHDRLLGSGCCLCMHFYLHVDALVQCMYSIQAHLLIAHVL